VQAYACRRPLVPNTLGDRVKAARVYQSVTDIRDGIMERWQHLAVLHSAPR